MNGATAAAVRLLYWISGRVNDNPQLAAECYRVARELEAFEQLRAAIRAPGTCACGREIVNASRGRRRTYCRTCRPTTTREMTEKFDKSEG